MTSFKFNSGLRKSRPIIDAAWPAMPEPLLGAYNQVLGASKAAARLGSGFTESVYQMAMAVHLNASGWNPPGSRWQTELVYPVSAGSDYFGTCRADIVLPMVTDSDVEDEIKVSGVVIECKAVKSITDEHRAQLFAYMRVGNVFTGFIANFCVGDPIQRCEVQVETYLRNGTRFT
jgi:GxxExxY protein